MVMDNLSNVFLSGAAIEFAGMKQEIEEAKPTDEELSEAIKMVVNWQLYSGSNFSSQLLNLFGKADKSNKRRLARGFPALAQAWLDWQFGGTEWLNQQVAIEKKA